MTAKKATNTHITSDFYPADTLYNLFSKQALNMPSGADKEKALHNLVDIVSSAKCLVENGQYLISAADIVAGVAGVSDGHKYMHVRRCQNDNFNTFLDKHSVRRPFPGKRRAIYTVTAEYIIPLINLLPMATLKEPLFGISERILNVDNIAYWRSNGNVVTFDDIKKHKDLYARISIRLATPELLTQFAQSLSLSKAKYILTACKEKAERDGLKLE